MGQEEVGRIFSPGPRKPAQRTNSSSSLSSTASSTSTLTPSSVSTNGTGAPPSDNWATRKKPTRGLWPPGKSEPTSGLSTARPQSVSSTTSGQSAASGLSALHTPLLPSQQMANGPAQQNGTARGVGTPEGSAFLYLLPMNGTFERKTIHVPYYPDVLRIGRQTNAKTAPTPANGFFDSKVLSRQHAEVYAERSGRIFIRDVKSSNGTFVNGKRLSPENKESEPHELREQDVLELGIDIVSEDQKTVVHHKVAARVEHAGVYAQNGDINFGDLDPANGNAFLGSQQGKRGPGHPALPGIKTGAPMGPPGTGPRDSSALQQPPWQRMWLQPVSTEHIVRRLNRELILARQQAQDLTRAKETFDSILLGKQDMTEGQEKVDSDQKALSSPKKKVEVNHFPEPPAPPPSQPLPEKPDTSHVLQDPVIQPLLQRSDTARPKSSDFSSGDHSSALFILTHELKAAKDQIPNLLDRVNLLEQQLRDERTARATAEERAYQLEHGPRKDSAEPTGALDNGEDKKSEPLEDYPIFDLSSRLQRLQNSMSDMKQQMESYRRRAETAESQRDDARQSLAELIEEKRTRMQHDLGKSRALKDRDSPIKDETNGWTSAEGTLYSGEDGDIDIKAEPEANGHTIRPTAQKHLPLTTLLEKAGLDSSPGRQINRQQAVNLQQVLKKEMLGSGAADGDVDGRELGRKLQEMMRLDGGLAYHGVPHACAFTTVVIGLVVMKWLNGWEKVQR